MTQATMGTEKAVAANRSNPAIAAYPLDEPTEYLANMDFGKRMR